MTRDFGLYERIREILPAASSSGDKKEAPPLSDITTYLAGIPLDQGAEALHTARLLMASFMRLRKEWDEAAERSSRRSLNATANKQRGDIGHNDSESESESSGSDE